MDMRLVTFNVKPDHVTAFESVTAEHVVQSRQEPGVVRFEFLKQDEDPTRFVLILGFENEQVRERHLAMAHTHSWRQAVTPMLVEPIRPKKVSVIA